MKLKWTRRALRQLVDAQDYIAQDDPHAARLVAQRIADAALLLLTQPQMGRPGRIADTREWIVSRSPYFLVYRQHDRALEVLAVIHSKQHWPPAPE